MARDIAAGLTNDESSRGAIGAPLILREHVVRRIPLFNNMRRNIRTALDTTALGVAHHVLVEPVSSAGHKTELTLMEGTL
jgi:hypothetical protein